MSDSELELEYGQMYEEFAEYLKDDKFFKAFAQDYGPNWRNNKSIPKKHYNIIYHLYVRREYVNSGGVDVSGTCYNALETMVSILFNNEPKSQDDTLIFASQYLEGRRMNNKCCDLMCQECLGEFYNYFPSREDVDSGIFNPHKNIILGDEGIKKKKKKKKKNNIVKTGKEKNSYFDIFPYKKIILFIITIFFLYMLMKYMFCG